MLFTDLNINSALQNALTDLGIEKATTIQSAAFPVIMSGKDVVGLAQTGTGKTFAYLLPLLRQFNFSKDKNPKILIVVPTRELVLQVVQEAEKLTTYMNFRIGGVYGGTNINTQKMVVLNGLDLLVATPGRLIDLVLNGSLKLKQIQKFVIDEVDEMMDLGFRPQLERIMDLLPPRRQNLMFSATLTEDVEKLINDFFENPIKITAAPSGTPLEKIEQIGIDVPNYYTKINLIKYYIENHPEMNKVMVFTKSKKFADMLFEQVENLLPNQLGLIHSNKSQNNRILELKKFIAGDYRFLIATDLVARGLDISDVSHVINFDMPEEQEMYIHRIGRTGRADKDGIAISFLTESDNEFWEQIQDYMKIQIAVENIPDGVEISSELLEIEKPVLKGMLVNKTPKAKVSGGFHEKIAKNKKVNLGGSYRREIKEKYKKPIRRRNNGNNK
ncbi:MAG: DEAD/DEAH box helicase [Cytophagales bacterium]